MTAVLETDIGVEFEYQTAPVTDIRVETEYDDQKGRDVVTGVAVKDELYKPSDRFWLSLFARYGFNKSMFKYFDYPEVFERIAMRHTDSLRFCVAKDEAGDGTLLAVSKPSKPVVDFGELSDLSRRHGALQLSYADGIVSTTHATRMQGQFEVAGDSFDPRYVIETPVDGYGMPNIYLAVLRLACTNLAMAQSKIFKSSLTLGKGEDDIGFALGRVFDQFSNDEGYAAIQSRLESATNSWASVAESMSLYKLIARCFNKGFIAGGDGAALDDDESVSLAAPVLDRFHALTGNISELYGLANVDALSIKRQRMLPTKCSMYELMNFATEFGTHYGNENGQRACSGWFGTAISNEYDMEGSKEIHSDFADYHIDARVDAGVTGS